MRGLSRWQRQCESDDAPDTEWYDMTQNNAKVVKREAVTPVTAQEGPYIFMEMDTSGVQ